mmetsp:Transcript_6487/g.9466  ORF Transcript_6487/g.9466 Transcript_6487/m.9466 type:complete len:86 (+) Transcript_6487:142-399(+)
MGTVILYTDTGWVSEYRRRRRRYFFTEQSSVQVQSEYIPLRNKEKLLAGKASKYEMGSHEESSSKSSSNISQDDSSTMDDCRCCG